MYVEIESFASGWHDIDIHMRQQDVDILIERLTQLKSSKNQHFHIFTDYSDEGGVSDIEFDIQEEGKHNMTITGFSIAPTR